MRVLPKPFDSHSPLTLVIRGVAGIVGFILSPLSWWNDLVVNFPLAYAFAWASGKLLSPFLTVHKWLFINLFVLGYFMTNLIGFLMIHYSILGFKKDRRTSFKKQILVSLGYSLVIMVFFGANICDPTEGCKILPSWVVP
jgi:hypothetical protein